LPRFKIKFDMELRPILNALGLSRLFDPTRADLSGMSEAGRLWVGEVVHAATIEVSEKGAEAATATGVFTLASAQRPIDLRATRPSSTMQAA
jgi:serine protease inhibitor